MKRRILVNISVIWEFLIGIISPLCCGCIYMCVTGNGKGYAYDLGAEKDFYIMCGIILLLVYLFLLIPPIWYLCKKCYDIKKVFMAVPLFCFAIYFGLGIYIIGGQQFLGFFNL